MMSTLEKIRAEICEMRSKQNCSCSDCLDIIDKYAGEPCEDAKSTKEVMRILTLLMSEAGKDGKLILSDAKAMIYDLPSVYQKTECEDAVGRQASFNTIESMYQKCDGDLQTYHDLLVDCFEVLPSVQPKAKTGRWIKDGDKLKCPICGAQGENIKDDYCYNFCPVCGSRMVEE